MRRRNNLSVGSLIEKSVSVISGASGGEIQREKREFLKFIIKTTGAIWISKYLLSCGKTIEPISINRNIFPLSVVSGDVKQKSAILWTKVSEKVGEGKNTVPLIVEVAEDIDFAKIVFQDVVEAKKENDFTTKIRVEGFSPGKTYFYRFVYDKDSSPIGRFKTIPEKPERIRFAFVSCQDYTNGFYSAYYHLANEDVDFVIHLGDYIYETAGEATFQYAQLRKISLPYGEKVALKIEDYRKLYQVYRSDPYLQRVHEKFPFYVIWDDHEFANDCYGANSPDNGKEEYGGIYQPERRKYAHKAWWEYMPAEVEYNPSQSDPTKEIKIWRAFTFGNLAELILTDERLYRNGPPESAECGGLVRGRYLTKFCNDILSEERSMLGKEQLEFLLDELKNAEDNGVIWKIHGNEVAMSQMLLGREEGKGKEGFSFLNFDQWDGFWGERQKILRYIHENNIKNYLVVTGDLHTWFAGELYADFENYQNPVGVEFAGTSITSSNLGSLLRLSEEQFKPLQDKIVEINPNLKFFDSTSHGYAICEITQEKAVVEFWKVSDIENPEVEKTEKILIAKFEVKKDESRIRRLI